MTARLLVLVLLAGAALTPTSAHAYVDPGAGSLVIQGIIAAVVGVGLTVRLFWSRIRKLLTGKTPRDDESDAES